MESVEILGPDVTLYRGDSRSVLREWGEEKVDSIVTSPPYADVRGDDYESVAPEEYADWFVSFLPSFEKALKPNGSLLVNFGRKFKDGIESSYVEQVLLRMEQTGWRRISGAGRTMRTASRVMTLGMRQCRKVAIRMREARVLGRST